MARSRNIKPGFFKNEDLAECDPLARLLFAGLWCEADREGRLEDRPKRLKAEYLPYDDCDADDLLWQLANRGFIARYQVDGLRFIAILSFGKHQNPHVKEGKSTIPPPPEPGASPVQEQCEPDECTSAAGLIPDSPFLIPDSPIPSSDDEGRAEARERPEFDVLACPEGINATAWSDWVGHRRSRRKPISARAAVEQWRALSGLSPPQQAACIAASIRNDWQGLFPEKFGGGHGGTSDRFGRDSGSAQSRSAVGRVRANAARELAAAAASGPAVDPHDRDVRPPLDLVVRG